MTATLRGIGIGLGAAVGPVVRMPAPVSEPSDAPSRIGATAERDRAYAALAAVAGDLRDRAAQAGGDAADVLEAQAMMAEDPGLAAEVATGITAGRTAARAVFEAFTGYRAALAAAGDYLAARVADLDDVRQRAVAACLGVDPPGVPAPGHPFVLVATDLAPADTSALDPSTVLALVTAQGGPTSHTAVLARARGIPAVVGCTGADEVADGTTVLVDAAAGLIVTDPDPVNAAARVAAAAPTRAEPVASGPGRLADGTPIALLANIGGPEDVASAVAAGAEGVGLFRTEFLYLDAVSAPSVASQTAIYRRVLAEFGGRRVVVRVLDAGADKPLAFLPPPAEPNPALGVRGLRLLRSYPQILRDQLTALQSAAAATTADVWVMAPMVADAADAAWFVAEAMAVGLPVAGAMVEVPAAALLADSILNAAAFVSVGTNDLTQYALAADRQLGRLGSLQDPWHPAVLRLVQLTGAAGARTGRPAGVCGEAAADPLLACVLVGFGASSLSMAPAALGAVRTALARHALADCVRMAELAVSASSAAEARAAVAAVARG